MKEAIELIRDKQIAMSSVESDVIENPNGELIKGAIVILDPEHTDLSDFPNNWNKGFCESVINKPWIERLVIVGALIAGEIDRLQKINSH